MFLSRQRFSARLAIPFACAALCILPRGMADGPGLGNFSYASGERLSMLALFDSTNGAPLGQGFVTMHRGYLLVPFSADGGGGNGTGGFAFYDVSDPRNVTLHFTTHNNPAYGPASPNNAGNIREPHGYSFAHFGGKDYVCFTTNVNGANASGLQVWDFTDVDTPAPAKIGQTGLPNLNGGDYAPSPWWVCWQGGRYAYVAGTSGGLYIVDLSDPANPALVDRRTPGQLGFPGSGVHTVFAIGNLLVLTGSQPGGEDLTGLATYDISDPANPVLLDYEADLAGYSAMVNGDRIYGARDPARVWSIADPSNITLVGIGPNVADKGGYGTVQDDYFHYGSSNAYVRMKVSGTPFTVDTVHSPTGFNNPDWDFATALGNLVFQGNDHSGSALIVHQTQPDTTGPSVNMVSPKPETVNCPLTSRVGVTFTDAVDLRSIDSTTFTVRPLNGEPLPGRYSHQTGIVNFWPDAHLLPDTTYEVRIAAGGIEDFAGNGVPTEFVSYFSTGASVVSVEVNGEGSGPATAGTVVDFSAASDAEEVEFSWNFGDGSEPTPFSDSSAASHTYPAVGHYPVTVTARAGGRTATSSFTQTIHHPLADGKPSGSMPILHDEETHRVWCVNPDADTVTAIDALSLGKIFEVPVGKHPRTLARAPGGAIWVVNQDDATLSVLDPTTGSTTNLIPLPRASRPYGIAFSPNGSAAWVTTEGTGRLLKIDPETGLQLGSVSFDGPLRGIAITADSSRVFLSRFVSPDAQGEVYEVNPLTLAPVRTLALAHDPGPDTEAGGRGLPNYLTSLAISPDGRRLWVPAKKDNIQRGLVRDGLPLTFESTTRTIVAQLDLSTNDEPEGTRVDLDDRDMAQAVAFSPLGDYACVLLQGSNSLSIVDAYSGAIAGGVDDFGLAPQGLAFNGTGTRLFVQNFMSRTVSVFDTSGIVDSSSTVVVPLATVSTVGTERLGSQVLHGKKIFYNARDSRMNRDGYLSCASCHLDGGSDGRVWDFSDRGEGLRRTTTLHGRGGMAQGPVHWSGNFDEIQDFENVIRGSFGGIGFMSDWQFHEGTRSHPLGDPKAGASADLDALAAYVSSLTATPPSPFRGQDGSLTPDALAGRELFVELSCFACHSGAGFTDSPAALLHDIGTLTPASGHRLGGPLPGIDTPTLKGIWKNNRYLHDGSAATLHDVLTVSDPDGLHGAAHGITNTQRQQLIAYLQQIEDPEIAPTIGDLATLVSPLPGASYALDASIHVEVAVTDASGPVSHVEFHRNGSLLAQVGSPPFETFWPASSGGLHTFSARIVFASGRITATREATVAVASPVPPIRVNFQTSGSTTPQGYLADTGAVFGDRDNGHAYGWTINLSSRTRERNTHPDKRYDTLCHMRPDADGPNQTWEIALPNGNYSVFAVFGDPDFTNFTNNVIIEGRNFIAAPNTNFNTFASDNLTITDGRLTISPGSGAQNPRICFVDITPQSLEIPEITLTAPVPVTGEFSSMPGVFRLTRTGSTATSLAVEVAVGGNATPGADYAPIPSQIVIPAGQSSVDIEVLPVADFLPEGPESVVLSLKSGNGYLPGIPGSAAVVIADALMDEWKKTHFTAPQRVTPAVSGDNADPDRNGIVNLLEYALGRDPLAARHQPPVTSGFDASGRLTLSFRRPMGAREDLLYTVQGTTDFSSWLSDPCFVAIAHTPHPDGTETVTATWLGDDDAAFMRLKVERQ